MKNQLERKAIQTMVRTYGQTPKQLFRVQHPPKKTLSQPRMSDTKMQWGPQYKVKKRAQLFKTNDVVS